MIFEVLQMDMKELTSGEETGFNDVSADSWLAPYAKKAIDSGVFTGFDDGLFQPDEPATRGEIMLYFRRAQDL
jgi:hypothetical protein